MRRRRRRQGKKEEVDGDVSDVGWWWWSLSLVVVVVCAGPILIYQHHHHHHHHYHIGRLVCVCVHALVLGFTSIADVASTHNTTNQRRTLSLGSIMAQSVCSCVCFITMHSSRLYIFFHCAYVYIFTLGKHLTCSINSTVIIWQINSRCDFYEDSLLLLLFMRTFIYLVTYLPCFIHVRLCVCE